MRRTYQALREQIDNCGMRHSAVAEKAGMRGYELSRLFTLDPEGLASEEMEARILAAIDSLAAGRVAS